MDWKSHRIEAVLEQALVEDQAVSDATTNVTIDPNLRASASIIARQDMVRCRPRRSAAVPRDLRPARSATRGAHPLRSRQPPGDLRRRPGAQGTEYWL